MEDKQLSPHFKASEFACRCCGKLPPGGMSKHLIERLEALRNICKVPLVITSGYRCEKHNKECGGVPNSAHTKGEAADIKNPFEKHDLVRLFELAGRAGFVRRGFYPSQNFVHVDVDKSLPQTTWRG